MSIPDGLLQLLPGHQFIGVLGQTDENIHHLGLKVLGVAICVGYGTP